MAIFQITPEALLALSETSFGSEGIMERSDLQRLLRDQIGALGRPLLVVAEEFGDWLDSSRRIDLLCLDTDANLVVVELKRTDDGGHMELQALRYAAMVSAMTFDQLVDTYVRFKARSQPRCQLDSEAARAQIMEFLGWSEIDEAEFCQDTKIVLAAANFSKEMTTAVMWLFERGIDIRCVRMRPYRMKDGTLLLDIQQLIPLPEAADFQTKLGVKKQAERQSLTDRHDLRLQFWEDLLHYARDRTNLHAGRNPPQGNWVSGSIGRSGFVLVYTVRKTDSQVDLGIWHDSGKATNKAAFKALMEQKPLIEADFGSPLDWQELPDGLGSRIRYTVLGGYKSPFSEWPRICTELVDAMIKLDTTFRNRVATLVWKV